MSNLTRLYFPVDLTGNFVMIEKLVLGEIYTGDLPIFNPDALTSAPSRQEKKRLRDLLAAILISCLTKITNGLSYIDVIYFNDKPSNYIK